MELLKFGKLSKTEYESLPLTDENTIYAVIENGDFSLVNASKKCELFIGNKRLSDVEIGNIKNLLTSNKSTVIDAINEIFTIVANEDGGSAKDSSILPFAGFMTADDMGNVVNMSSTVEGGQIYCSYDRKRFFYKINNLFYTNWQTAYLYNDNYSSQSPTAKTGAIFSYNGKHYTMYNGTLQDMSVLDDIGNMTTPGIVMLSDSTSGSTYDANRGVAATPKALADLAVIARNYTNAQIAAKIQLVDVLPDNPIAGVLYCIPE